MPTVHAAAALLAAALRRYEAVTSPAEAAALLASLAALVRSAEDRTRAEALINRLYPDLALSFRESAF